MYFGIAFNPDGITQTDMGYRYLTTALPEVVELESNPGARPDVRDGFYFRELGVSEGTGITGYIYTTQQPGTSEMTQIYRTDLFLKNTRTGPPGTAPTGTVNQEQGDHAYTTKSTFERSQPGTWRQEIVRGFVRELSPNVGGVAAPARSAAVQVQASATESSPAITSLIDRPLVIRNAVTSPALTGLIASADEIHFNTGGLASKSHRVVSSQAPLRRGAGFRIHPGGSAPSNSNGDTLRSDSTNRQIPFHSDGIDSIDILFSHWNDLVGLLP
jgi:hypothetical protein